MKKILIRVIKRKDVKAATNAKILNPPLEPAAATPDGVEKSARHSRREIVETISKWIPERQNNNRLEEISAVRKFFGSDLSLNEV